MATENTVKVLSWIQFGNPIRTDVNCRVLGTRILVGNTYTYTLQASIYDDDYTPIAANKGNVEVGYRLINSSTGLVQTGKIYVNVGSSGGRTQFSITREYDKVEVLPTNSINNTTNLNIKYDTTQYNLETI